MARNKNKQKPSVAPFWRAEEENIYDWYMYFDRLVEIAISLFEWEGLPKGVDTRFLELGLFRDGMMVFFKDEDLIGEDSDGYFALRTMVGGNWSVYDIPKERTAYATNGYNNMLNDTNSVIIYNNLLHTNGINQIVQFSKRLSELDRTIDINTNAQKTPILIRCDDKERLSLQNLYKKYNGNSPVIYADKGLDPKPLDVLMTGAPYVADKLYELKTQIWNEALTFLGIPNVTDTKPERLIKDEVNRSQGGVIANRYSRLTARQQACEQINEMFRLDLSVNYRDEYREENINTELPNVKDENIQEEKGDETNV